MQRLTTTRVFIIMLALGVPACAPVTQEREVLSFEPARRGRGSDEISREEARAVEGTTAADVIARLRPEFLRAKSSRVALDQQVAPSVYHNGAFAGGLDVLGTIPIAPILDIRYLTPVAARSHYGSYCKCEGGVILVRTRVDGVLLPSVESSAPARSQDPNS